MNPQTAQIPKTKTSSCTSEHSMEHAMSAYHQELPHGAGLIMISVEYFRYFIERNVCGERFVKMAKLLGMENAAKPEDELDTPAKKSVLMRARACSFPTMTLRQWKCLRDL